MKTLKTYTRLLLLPLLVMLFLALHSCVAPTDIDDKGNVIIEPPPYTPAPLVKAEKVELQIINERNLLPNDDNRPLWDNEIEHNILIDTNKPEIIDPITSVKKKRILPRILLNLTAIVKQNSANPRDKNGFVLRKISLFLPDTIDLENEEEIIYSTNNLPSQNSYFEYTYKQQTIVKAFINPNTGRLVVKAAKLEQRNVIMIEFTYDVFPSANGVVVPQERLHGTGRIVVRY